MKPRKIKYKIFSHSVRRSRSWSKSRTFVRIKLCVGLPQIGKRRLFWPYSWKAGRFKKDRW